MNNFYKYQRPPSPYLLVFMYLALLVLLVFGIWFLVEDQRGARMWCSVRDGVWVSDTPASGGCYGLNENR